MFRRSLLAGLIVSGALAASGARADDTIRILTPTWSGYAPLYVAQDLGYFEQEGIKVEMSLDDQRSDVMAAMERGDIEMEMRTLGEYQGRPRTRQSAGVIIGTIDESRGGDGVMAAGDIKDVTGLKGKTVAAETNQPGRLLLQLELAKHGMSTADLAIREIMTADSVAVFADPAISAVVAYEPFFSQMKKNLPAREPHLVVSSADYPGYIVDVIIVRQADLADNPEKYRKFLRALYRAERYFETDRDAFVKLAAPHFNLSVADFEDSIRGTLVYHSLADAKDEMGTPDAPGRLYKVFDELMELNLANGAADEALVAKESIDSSVIGNLAP